MECEKCQDKGFTEQEHGLIVILCDCDKGRAITESIFMPWSGDDSISGTEPDNPNLGSTDTSQPKRTREPKAKKKARARAG